MSTPLLVAVVQGLDPRPVSGQKQAVSSLVPQREGELAVETLDAPVAPLLVAVDDDLRVRLSGEAMASVAQLDAELLVVEDLSIEHPPTPWSPRWQWAAGPPPRR